jgi:hypothetical protein
VVWSTVTHEVKEEAIDAITEHIKELTPTLNSCLTINRVLQQAVNCHYNMRIVQPTSVCQWQGIGAVR